MYTQNQCILHQKKKKNQKKTTDLAFGVLFKG